MDYAIEISDVERKLHFHTHFLVRLTAIDLFQYTHILVDVPVATEQKHDVFSI